MLPHSSRQAVWAAPYLWWPLQDLRLKEEFIWPGVWPRHVVDSLCHYCWGAPLWYILPAAGIPDEAAPSTALRWQLKGDLFITQRVQLEKHLRMFLTLNVYKSPFWLDWGCDSSVSMNMPSNSGYGHPPHPLTFFCCYLLPLIQEFLPFLGPTVLL